MEGFYMISMSDIRKKSCLLFCANISQHFCHQRFSRVTRVKAKIRFIWREEEAWNQQCLISSRVEYSQENYGYLAWQSENIFERSFRSRFSLCFLSRGQFSNFLKRLYIRQEEKWKSLFRNLIFNFAYIIFNLFPCNFQPYSFYVSYYLKSRFSVAWLTDKRKVCWAPKAQHKKERGWALGVKRGSGKKCELTNKHFSFRRFE